MREDSLQQRAERLGDRRFIGGPVYDFERMGLAVLDVLLREGIRSDTRLLDVGCGALRLGYWAMRLLNRGGYHGIEPNREMLQAGIDELVGADVVARCEARFDHNDRFDFTVFDERFDIVVARSVWTHASKAQIEAMLDSFALTAAPEAVFLASYYPAGAMFDLSGRSRALGRAAGSMPLAPLSPVIARVPSAMPANEYRGQGWVGRSTESDEPGVTKHTLHWIAGAAAVRGLRARLVPYPVLHRQYWVRIERG